MVRYGDGWPDSYCGCEGCFNYWLQTFADGRPDGFDLYWDNEWDDRAITTQACDLYVIPVLLRAWGCE